MAKFDGKTLAIVKRLQKARLSLLQKYPFYAILLMYMKFSLDLSCQTAYTDGDRIAFHPDFMEELSDSELEFVLMHEVLHAVLGHPFRHQQDYDVQAFDIACDIVVNSNILHSVRGDTKAITLRKYGEAMHLAPNGKEGFLYTAEQVYAMVRKTMEQQKKKKSAPPGEGSCRCDEGESNKENRDEKKPDAKGTGRDDSKKGQKGKGGCGGRDGGVGKGGSADTAGEPDKNNPTQADMQKLIASILQRKEENGGTDQQAKQQNGVADAQKQEADQRQTLDDHSFWEGDDETSGQRDVWLQRMINATQITGSADGGCGSVPAGVQRLIQQLKQPVLDWRTILNDFVQEEICDYSFAPPDKRMEDSPFFLPDFNEKDEKVKDILFMIDTSASMSDIEITQCYSEIYGAIGQFNGKLQGKLGFFDAQVVAPVPFEDEEEFKVIRPEGGGGTSFSAIFEYIEAYMMDELPVSIVILTDGGAPWPKETAAMGIPVLWIINNKVATPPWGKVARLVEK